MLIQKRLSQRQKRLDLSYGGPMGAKIFCMDAVASEFEGRSGGAGRRVGGVCKLAPPPSMQQPMHGCHVRPYGVHGVALAALASSPSSSPCSCQQQPQLLHCPQSNAEVLNPALKLGHAHPNRICAR